jgi:mRNA interferase RelE/StbE
MLILYVYRIVFAKRADKALRKMPRNTAKLIREKLDEIAADPHAKHNNVTRLQNRPAFRLRMGGWRVIYELHDDELVVLVLRIGPRGGVYR